MHHARCLCQRHQNFASTLPQTQTNVTYLHAGDEGNNESSVIGVGIPWGG